MRGRGDTDTGGKGSLEIKPLITVSWGGPQWLYAAMSPLMGMSGQSAPIKGLGEAEGKLGGTGQ